jgi:Arc/MetJ-type ribon-helix-helix transcriptional regulator
MNITLTGEQESALSSLVAAGDYPSIEEAARALLDERLSLNELEESDPEVTRGLLAEAEADIEAGAVMTLEEHRTRIEALLKNLA